MALERSLAADLSRSILRLPSRRRELAEACWEEEGEGRKAAMSQSEWRV